MLCCLAAVVVVSLVQAGPARGDIIVNFDSNPNLGTQPNSFSNTGPMQTYAQAGVYSITGGVALSDPLGLAAFPTQGSGHNLYGTSDISNYDLSPTITLTLPTAEGVTNVSGVFFNGQSQAETYTLTAFSNGVAVGTPTTVTLAEAANSSDFYNFSFGSTSALPITSVTFTTPNADLNGYDFFVDTIDITPGIVTSVPEPSSIILCGLAGTLGLVTTAVRRRRANRST